MNSATPGQVSSVRHSNSCTRRKKRICLVVCSGAMLAIVITIVLTTFNGNFSDEEKRAQIKKLYEAYRRDFPLITDIRAGELSAAKTQGHVVIIDVRESVEQEVSMIPGAISTGQFKREADRYKRSTIVAYCTIGSRSGLYAKELQDKGYSVSNLRGGILSWAHAGQSVANNAGLTNRVHVYGSKWNLLPEGYVAVW